MVDKKLTDINYRHSYARGIANKLDSKDSEGQDGKIIASVWNRFVSDKYGKKINQFIGINAAIKSISTYLFYEAKATNELISDIGDKWESSIDSSTSAKNTQQSEPEEKSKNSSAKEKNTVDTEAAKKTQKAKKTNKNNNSSKDVASNKNASIYEPTTTDAQNNIYKTDNRYAKLSKAKALEKAQKDPRLEKLNGGKGWSVSTGSFRTDVQYARKYTGKILSYIAQITNAEIIITSALGTGQAGNPHQKHGYASHHNAENPKLDLKAQNCSLKELQARLKKTGFFSRVSRERTHLDVQIKPEVYLAFEQNLTGQEVSQLIKNKKSSDFGLA